MGSLDHADATAPVPAAPERVGLPDATCCRRPMTGIEVTSPQSQATAVLGLLTCSSCGRHVWLRDGQVLDRDDVLAIVRDRIAEGPVARVPRPRSPR